jgi:hypothetical protein
MNNNLLQTLQETHQALKEGCDELKLTLEELRVGRCTIDQKQEVIDRIKALKELYQQQIQELSLTLPDGRTLLRPQYEALERFAGNNNCTVEDLLELDRVTINRGVIVECNFSARGLTTLEGLQGIWSIKKLVVGHNEGLTSLKGIPVQEIENIAAVRCTLTGDLSEITGATKLKELHVCGNEGLTSLNGVPTQEIEEIAASYCALTGDLSEIAGASKLKRLYVRKNQGLTSLKGVPTQEITEIEAKVCGLTGDHTFLSEAKQLSKLHLDDNPSSLTLDRSAFAPGVVVLQDIAPFIE